MEIQQNMEIQQKRFEWTTVMGMPLSKMETTTEYGNATEYGNTTETFRTDYSHQHAIINKIYLELNTLLSIFSLLANILIGFVTCRYSRLYRERSNIIILNWVIINSVFVVCVPITLRIINESDPSIVNNKTICFVDELLFTLISTNILLIILLTIYWFMKLHCTNNFVKFHRHLIFFICAVYVFSLCCLGIHVDSCYNGRIYAVSVIILSLILLFFILFMICINIIHAIKKRTMIQLSNGNGKNIPHILTNVFFASYLPVILAISFITLSVGQELVGKSILYLTLLLCYINPIYFVIILYKYDSDYNTYFKHVLTCRCKEYNEEFTEQPVSFNKDSIVENKC